MTAHINAAAASTSVDLPTATHWERVAQSSWGRYLTEVEKDVILRGEAWSGGPGKAVDLGCGGGRWSKLLAGLGWEMSCMDTNRHALALCQQKVASAKCILAAAGDRTLPIASRTANLALCIEVIPLIEAEWFVPEVHRILLPRGILIGVYINGRSLRGIAWRIKHKLLGVQDTVESEFYRSSYPEWKQRLLGNGFEMLHEESCCWGPFTRDSNSPFVPACAKMERALRLHRVVNWSPWVVFVARKLDSP
jgi:SAM-dependent methyltransferase